MSETARRRTLVAWVVSAGLLSLLALALALGLGLSAPVPAELRRPLAAVGVAMLYGAFAAFFFAGRRGKPAISRTTVLVGVASQTGYATRLAEQTVAALRAGGVSAQHALLGQLTLSDLLAAGQVLLIASTAGEGQPPDTASAFVRGPMRQAAMLHSLSYGLLALGDRSYTQYCAFGRSLARWLEASGARPLFPTIEVDAQDGAALTRWQEHVTALGGRTTGRAEEPAATVWRLRARHLLNAGSQGAPAYLLHFDAEGPLPAWTAGDLADITIPDANGAGARQRLYSIASLPNEGRLSLLVRQALRPDGTRGLGSGYLTTALALDAPLSLRIRPNPSFHPTPDARPLILIGNGTGLAGLRAHLQARAQANHRRNWLIFGERQAAYDHFFREDLANWHRTGMLERLDTVFSRDQPARLYVQDKLLQAAQTLRHWIDDGADILVCGSLHGMAAGVDTALVDSLGADRVTELRQTGRYRRDVY
jgi:sulfite reductase (NADPH) flavoprotein alpha-component